MCWEIPKCCYSCSLVFWSSLDKGVRLICLWTEAEGLLEERLDDEARELLGDKRFLLGENIFLKFYKR